MIDLRRKAPAWAKREERERRAELVEVRKFRHKRVPTKTQLARAVYLWKRRGCGEFVSYIDRNRLNLTYILKHL